MLRIEDGRVQRGRTIDAILKGTVLACAILLLGGLFDAVRAQDYQTRKLIRNLLKIGYPLDRDDVIALDKIGMRFNVENRIDVLQKILLDRESIHNRKRYDYYTRTEVICDALRLLDEHDLPVANALIDDLNRQEGWEVREKALVAFMAAKRGVRYRANTDYLLDALQQYERDLEKNEGIEASQAIIDIMNFLSYISDLFAFKGDEKILAALFEYSSGAYGFPAEYLSHMFVDMFLFNPEIFVSKLAVQDNRTRKSVIRALVFGMRNNQVREKVKIILAQDLFAKQGADHAAANLIMGKLRTQIDQIADQAPAKAPGTNTGGDR